MNILKLEDLKRVKPLRHIDHGRVCQEVSQLETTVRTDPLQLRPFSPHKVTIGGAEYWAYDARAVNRQANQSGRGNYRYLLSRGEYAGVAIHTPSGDYRKVA